MNSQETPNQKPGLYGNMVDFGSYTIQGQKIPLAYEPATRRMFLGIETPNGVQYVAIRNAQNPRA